MITARPTWVDEPLRRFVSDAGVSLALLARPSGQLLAQVGFARSMDVMSACALAAAANATSAALGKILDGTAFNGLHHASSTRQAYLVTSDIPQGPYLLLAVFGEDSSLGLVRLCFDELQRQLASAAPAGERKRGPARMDTFERELNESLSLAFEEAS